MKIKDAQRIVNEYRGKSILSEVEEFSFIEALEFLIDKTKDTKYMIELGGYYYEHKKYDLAFKYYEMADTYGDKWAAEGLGYIYYYGRTGVVDYPKAFFYFEKASKAGYFNSTLKVADMYKHGYGVEEDHQKYKEMIEEAYAYVNTHRGNDYHKPSVYTRLASIYKKEGRKEEAIELYLEAKDILKWRIRVDHFWGSINVMKWLIQDVYTLMDIDLNHLDLFDLFVVLDKPNKVKFYYEEKEYEIEAIEEEGDIVIHFMDKWYRTIDGFFYNASIDGEMLVVLAESLYNFSLEKEYGNH